jgi:hypothetical protein
VKAKKVEEIKEIKEEIKETKWTFLKTFGKELEWE